MKKVALSIVSLSLLLSFGCASKDYVHQQMEPLIERISKLEAKGDCCPKAEASAKRAEEAAIKCEKKCEKSFELQQLK